MMGSEQPIQGVTGPPEDSSRGKCAPLECAPAKKEGVVIRIENEKTARIRQVAVEQLSKLGLIKNRP
jgi:hypothetical protein